MKTSTASLTKGIVAAALVIIAAAPIVAGGVENVPKWVFILNFILATVILVIVFRDNGRGK